MSTFYAKTITDLTGWGVTKHCWLVSQTTTKNIRADRLFVFSFVFSFFFLFFFFFVIAVIVVTACLLACLFAYLMSCVFLSFFFFVF